MAKYLLCLLCLLLSNSSLASECVLTNGKYNATCAACWQGSWTPRMQALYCEGISPSQFLTAPVTQAPKCVPSSNIETRPCPVDYSGVETWKNETTCTTSESSRSTGWIKVSDSCVKIVIPPPIVPVTPIVPVVPSTPTQTAVKLVTSPVVPLTPLPAPPMPAPVTPTVQPTVETPQVSAPTPSVTPAPTPAPVSPKGSIAKALEITQKLTLAGAIPKQPSLIDLISLNQELPDGIRRQQNLFLELIQPDDSWLDRDFPAYYRGSGIFGD